MIINDILKFRDKAQSDIFFDYDINKLNWFNIGGKVAIFFKPKSLKELIEFLQLYSNRGNIFILGAGSNVLFKDEKFDGVVIKLGKNFSNISVLDKNKIIAGGAVNQKKLSNFAMENNIGGLEFLSCIPGTIGGGIRMNSGCFQKEFKDVLLSIQFIDFNGVIKTLPARQVIFNYRNIDLPNNIIFLSATFQGNNKQKIKIKKHIDELNSKKNLAQPTKVKTGGSTFKNPKNQTDEKAWKLIKESVSIKTSFGDAAISEKHVNFFINKKNAKFNDMKLLIDYVKKNVKKKKGIELQLEIVIVE